MQISAAELVKQDRQGKLQALQVVEDSTKLKAQEVQVVALEVQLRQLMWQAVHPLPSFQPPTLQLKQSEVDRQSLQRAGQGGQRLLFK
jgi:hypothetical protein